MPDTLRQFLARYLPVTATSPETGEVRCYITKYISNQGHVLPADKQDRLNTVAGACRSESFVSALGGTKHSGHVITVPQFGITQVNVSGLFQACFVGKATPRQFQQAILLYTFWDMRTRGKTGGYKPSDTWASVQQYADDNWGVDCNGFVAAFLRENYPGVLGSSNDIPVSATVSTSGGKPEVHGHPFATGGTVRTDIEDVRAGDVIIYNHRHIAILGDNMTPGIYLFEDKTVGKKTVTYTTGRFELYQSRGYKAGGVQCNYYDVTHKGGHEFAIRSVTPTFGSLENVKAIVRPKGLPEW